MEIRITGTQKECECVVKRVTENIPFGYLPSVSKFYPNKNQEESLRIGRVYIRFLIVNYRLRQEVKQ